MMERYRTAKSMKYQPEELWFPLSEDILSWDEDFHTLMLNDAIRMEAYERAIKQVVRPGMVVLDLGTGTGILAQWALEAGAARVYGVDVRPERIKDALARLGRQGFAGQFIPLVGFSSDVVLPERVDLIVSEILGNLGDNEDMTPILADARQRFLKPEGVMLPRRVETYLVPVDSHKLDDALKLRQVKILSSHYSIDELWTSRGGEPYNLYYDAIIPTSTCLSRPQQVQRFDFQGDDQKEYTTRLTYVVERAGLLTGFKGYFVAELAPGVNLDISGDDIKNRQTSDCWKHAYLPINESVSVLLGDVIELEFSRYYPNDGTAFRQGYGWQGIASRHGQTIAKFNQSTV